GWNNSNTTVTFLCSPGSSLIAVCPAAVVVSAEAANRTISGTARDYNGLTASASISVKLDKTPPEVTIDSSGDGTATKAAVQVTGTVTDALSGVRAATCNGKAAAITGLAFTCTVDLTHGRT